MQWYYSKNSMQLGPISQAELLSKINSGEVLRSDMVWRDGMPDWKPASQIAEFGLSAPAVLTPPPPPQAGYEATAPYAPPSQVSMQPTSMMIPNYLWQSIVVTILCCWPCGIPAIVYAAKVDGLKMQGNINAAMEASANAKKWCIISLAGWGIVVALYVLFVLIAVIGGAANS